MPDIQTFKFNQSGFENIKAMPLGRDWPVVYIIENGAEVYIGETTSALSRSRQHALNSSRLKLNQIHIIFDDEFNKSAALDTESLLIQYFAAEGTLRLQNGNRGLLNHNYFDRDKYRARFEAVVWKELQKKGLVKKELLEIKNSQLFKFSPYKALTEDQLLIAEALQASILSSESGTNIVNGGPGTGKTVLATYLVKALKENEKTKHLNVGLVIPMPSLRKSIQKVFSYIDGLSPSMVLGPSSTVDANYDVLLVDEAHRLRQRKNLANYRSHDAINKKLNLGKEGTELDWVLAQSKHQILFYDLNQTIRPTDVHAKRFADIHATHHNLISQLRVSGGEAYINFIEGIFSENNELKADFLNYDFKIYDDVAQMINDIKKKDSTFELCRVVAGYAWPWVSRNNPDVYDIEIGDAKLRWNSRLNDWVNSENAINEVGCIHTVQGYDLNYVGVIVGADLTFDVKKGCLKIDPEQYEDRNGWRGVKNNAELEQYIFNIYKTLMTRGMKGCYVYFMDKNVEKYFRNRLNLSE